jgi:hypothetical protein
MDDKTLRFTESMVYRKISWFDAIHEINENWYTTNNNEIEWRKKNTTLFKNPIEKSVPVSRISHYITNLVCYTYFHWFFNPECQHIFGKQTGYIFQSSKTIKTWTTKHYASLNQWFIEKFRGLMLSMKSTKIGIQRIIMK